MGEYAKANIEYLEHEVFGRIRTVHVDGERWFLAKDIALALGYARPSNAVRTHCKDAMSIITDGHLECGGPPCKFIAKPDVYRLIFRSKLKGAEVFSRWVAEEVAQRPVKFTASHDDLDKFPKILPVWEAARELAELRGHDRERAVLIADRVCKRDFGYDMSGFDAPNSECDDGDS